MKNQLLLPLTVLLLALTPAFLQAQIPAEFVGTYVGVYTEPDGDKEKATVEISSTGSVIVTLSDEEYGEMEVDVYSGKINADGTFKLVDKTDKDEFFIGKIEGKKLTGKIEDDGKLEGNLVAEKEA